MRKLQWATLIISSLYALFYILFATSALPSKIGFGVMLIPAALILGALLLGLHKSLFGAIAFIVLGIIAFFFYGGYTSLIQFAITGLPFIALAVLFFIDFKKN